MSSTSGGRRIRASWPNWCTTRFGAALGGVVWGQAVLATAVILLPHYLVYGEAVTFGLAYRAAAVTVLLPWSLARSAAPHLGRLCLHFFGRVPDPAFVTALITPLAGCLVATGIIAGLRTLRRGRRLVIGGLAIVGAAAVVASAALALQLGDCVRAEEQFFALMSLSETPYQSPRAVAGAERFVVEHPDSRWRSEALRITALAAEASGDDGAAERDWRRFGDSFSDPMVPGVAYAAYSRAQCWERIGSSRRAARHYRDAVSVIQGRSDGIQGWIGSDGATALARMEFAQGRPLRAEYWIDKANDVSVTGRD